MTIVIIEPHPDDTFLSLGATLEKLYKEGEKIIVTVFSDKRRTKEAEGYAKAIGAESRCLGLEESKMTGGSSPKIVEPLLRLLEDDIELTGAESTVFYPVGLQHPDHLSVNFTVKKSLFYAERREYLDSPYLSKLKMGDAMRERTKGREIDSIVFPGKRKWRHHTIFKSQSKFFHFNKDLFEAKLPEIVLTAPRRL